MTGDVVTPNIRPLGRGFYEVRIDTQLADCWICMTTEPPKLVLGKRWARWKARRMMAAELRYQARR